MKRKFLAFLALISVLIVMFALIGCEMGQQHICKSVCPLCGKCTDFSCENDACRNKCLGHELDTPLVVLNGNVASWEAIDNASEYEVFVDGISIGKQTGLSYTIAETKVGTYKLKVVAIAAGKPYSDSIESNEVTYTIFPTQLSAPVITIDENVVSWQQVDNAKEYEVYVDDNLVSTQTELSYNLPEVFGKHTVNVVAIAGNAQFANSTFSNSVSYIVGLDSIDVESLSALGRSTAEFSKVGINNIGLYFGMKFTVTKDGYLLKARIYAPAGETGTHKVALWERDAVPGKQLLGEWTWDFGTAETEGWYEFELPTPVLLKAGGDNVYIIGVTLGDNLELGRGKAFDSDETHGLIRTYIGSGLQGSEVGAMPKVEWQCENYMRDIIFVEKDAYESITETKTLATPEVSLNGKVASWTAVEHAVGYEVFVNGESKGVQNGLSYTVEKTEPGSYAIAVVAKSNIALFRDSDISNTVTLEIEQIVELQKPVVEANGATISWAAVPNATSYEVYCDGTKVGTTDKLSYHLTSDVLASKANAYVVAKSTGANFKDSAPSNIVEVKFGVEDVNIGAKSALGNTTATFSKVGNGNIGLYFGMKFTVTKDGYLLKARIYAPAGETGTHKVALWERDAVPGKQLLGEWTWDFGTAETEGWYEFELPTPVLLKAGGDNVYIIGVTLGDNLELGRGKAFDSDEAHGLIRTYIGSGLQGTSVGTMPTLAYNAENYMRDIIFVEKDAYLSLFNATVLDAPQITLNETIVFWNAVSNAAGYEVFVNGKSKGVQEEMSYDLSDLPAGEYVVTVVATAGSFEFMNSGESNQVIYTRSLSANEYPTENALGDSTATFSKVGSGNVGLYFGMKFTVDQDGYLLKARIYAPAGETGIHKVALWERDAAPENQLLGEWTWDFGTAETEGWYEFELPTPVFLKAGGDKVYIIGVTLGDNLELGRGKAFTADEDHGLIRTYINSGLQGTSVGAMPTFAYDAENYMRDIVFAEKSAYEAAQQDATV